MALNKEALKARFKALTEKPADNMFKPEEGTTEIRIVPLKSNPEDPFIQAYFHYNLGGKTYLSPLTYSERDPIAEFSDMLIGEGGLSKEEWIAAKKFSPTLRYYVPIVVRGKESEGVKFWAFGKQTNEKLMAIMMDDEYGDITDVKDGSDLKVVFTPKEKSPTNFAQTDFTVKRKPSPLSTDKEVLKKLLEDQPDLLASFKRHTFEELQSALQAYLDGTTGNEPASSESASEPVVETPVAAPTALAADVAAEFDEVFNS